MLKMKIILISSLLIFFLLGVLGFLANRFFFEAGILGISSDYQAKDFDPRLNQEATTAKPLIAALMKYREKSKTFPQHFGDCEGLLSNPPWARMKPKDDFFSGWDYSQLSNGQKFMLYHRLGWDPFLKYEYDGTNGSWVFDPGNGNPRTTVQLKP